MPAVIRKPKTIPELIRDKGLAKLVLPKISKIITNVVQLGPRVVLRSATQLLRVNPLTRIISVTSLTLVDVYLLSRSRISNHQFFINLVYSSTMFLGSTVGWYTGRHIASQLALDVVLAFIVSLVFLLVGNTVADRLTRAVVSRVAETDCQKGLREINALCPEDLHIEVTKEQCIEVFRMDGDARRRCIQETIAKASEDADIGAAELVAER